MKKSTIITDLQDMLDSNLPGVKYIGKDWGQLYMENPPVGWPCILIDIEEVDPKPLIGRNEKDKAIVVLTVANRRSNSSSAHASRISKEKAMETLDLTDDIHGLVQGYAAEGKEYTPMNVVSFRKIYDFEEAKKLGCMA